MFCARLRECVHVCESEYVCVCATVRVSNGRGGKVQIVCVFVRTSVLSMMSFLQVSTLDKHIKGWKKYFMQ